LSIALSIKILRRLLFVKGGGFGLVGDLVVGIIGALLGGFVFGLLGVSAGGLLGSLVCATVGAVLLLVILPAIKRGP
jgi:uncharacterized membrane protein YeaQ/YmgE (transglycosylase-associated protein family)